MSFLLSAPILCIEEIPVRDLDPDLFGFFYPQAGDQNKVIR